MTETNRKRERSAGAPRLPKLDPAHMPKEGNMKDVTIPETEASGITYPVTIRVFETLDEAREEMDGGDEAILSNINAKQRQSALQSPKGSVREAIEAAEEAGFSEEEIQQAADDGSSEEEALQAVCDAIQHHQSVALDFILGSPRGASDGVNKTTAREVGDRVADALDRDPERLRELADQLGVDVDDLL